MTNDSIRYKGIVTLTVGDMVVEVTNTGTAELGYVICKALAGQSVVGRIPRYFDIQIKEGNEYTSLLNKKIPFTGQTYTTETEATTEELNELTLLATVLHSDKKNTLITPRDELRFVIKSEQGYVLAYITEVEDKKTNLSDIFNNIVPGVDCVIEWHMKILNNGNDSVRHIGEK